jgi:phospholipid/cholesterol/gamma-HCH transport system permease protein
MIQAIDHIGKSTIEFYQQIRSVFLFAYLSFRSIFGLRFRNLGPILFTLTSQIYFTGFQSLPLITFIALASGSIIVLQSTAQLSLFGSQEMMGNILVVTIVRELGPLLTAFTVIARSGTAVATEIGSMQVNREIESLRTMSIEPLAFVVLPRIVGGVICLISLAFYFNCIALFGGYLVNNLVSDLSFSFYLEVLAQSITPQDLSLNLIKNTFSGLLIFSISTYYGMKVSGAPHEIPVATTKAVVRSIVAVVAFNLSITVFLFWRSFG